MPPQVYLRVVKLRAECKCDKSRALVTVAYRPSYIEDAIMQQSIQFGLTRFVNTQHLTGYH